MKKQTLKGLALTILLTANSVSGNEEIPTKEEPEHQKNIENKVQNYESIIKDIQSKRNEFQEEYSNANSNERKEIIRESKEYLLDEISKSIIPAWKGTAYNFSGNSERPNGEEGIACGHFVTNVLDDAGFNINSDYLGKKRARYIIKTFTENNEIYRGVSAKQFSNNLSEKKDGVYILGLDQHTAMIVKDNEESKICHAAYYNPLEVTCESLNKSPALHNSTHKEIGNVLNDDAVKGWVKGKYLRP